ncbi:glycosyltransferase family protein [Paenibacillus gallinarum]|uniref:Glycosyltransferase n=1 Tax=Paenibacillus gallinarum TaxID=2762232 RepID=A0ABR8SSJ9_9BACL|nr:glycosyltransferase [Paenibacillus gallinarum]MBD7966474.1 glycosyltransferase [Paenibacillus gallinarum]
MKKNEKSVSSLHKKTAAPRTKRAVTKKRKPAKVTTASKVLSFPQKIPNLGVQVDHPLPENRSSANSLTPSNKPSLSIRDAKKLRLLLLWENDAGLPSTEIRFRQSLRMLFKEVLPLKVEDNLSNAIALYQPDILLVVGNRTDLPLTHQLPYLKDLKTVLWLNDMHDPIPYLNTSHDSLVWDYVITQNPNHIPMYQKSTNSKVIYLPFGSDPELFAPEKAPAHIQSDLLLLGDYEPRLAPYLDAIHRSTPDGRILAIGNNWGDIPGVEPWIPETSHDLKQLYNGADIIISFGENDRRRLDIAACGGFLLAEYDFNLDIYMKTGEDFVSFHCPEELSSHVTYYREHPEEKRKISSRALVRSEYDYSFFHLIMDFTNTLLEGQ